MFALLSALILYKTDPLCYLWIANREVSITSNRWNLKKIFPKGEDVLKRLNFHECTVLQISNFKINPSSYSKKNIEIDICRREQKKIFPPKL